MSKVWYVLSFELNSVPVLSFTHENSSAFQLANVCLLLTANGLLLKNVHSEIERLMGLMSFFPTVKIAHLS